MDAWTQIYKFFTLEMPEPHSFGWFHLLWLFILILVCVGGVFLANYKHSEKTLRLVLLIAGIVMLAFELYKQIFYVGFTMRDGVAVFDYAWYAFPFQLCSVPMYLMIIAFFLKPGKVRDCILGFLAMFGLFGGLVTYIYPEQVFVSMIGINLQTMIHHGTQIAVGVFLFAYYRKTLDVKNWNLWFWLGSFITFGIVFSIALILDSFVPKLIHDTGFNMFYISPYTDCTLPILSSIYPVVPYFAFLLIYVVGFCIVASIIYWMAYGINKLCMMVHSHPRNKKDNVAA